MPDCQKSLSDTVRKARHRTKLSQAELAEKLRIGLRTVDNIENYRSNLTMEALYPLITTLHIDPATSFI
ncbi:helix-turn-helix domain-containing protein [Ruthenibacterium lactatiformans]|uniref:helix-turn-helix domain-containing protein n=1 Tax=Ruthenibacterium lactatiformans TaxID=1550024 RepID=UPI003A4D738D